MTNEDKFRQFDDAEPEKLKPLMDRIDAEVRQMAEVARYHAPLYINQEAPPVKNDVSKLPKWAQEKIANQEREIVRLRDSVSILEGVTAGARDNLDEFLDTDVWLDRGIGEDLPLPKGSRIQFGDKKYGLRVNLDSDGNLEVNSSWGGIQVRPRAGNAIIVTEDYR